MKAIRKIIAALVALSACMSYTFALADNVNTNYSDSAYQTVSTVADSGKCGDNLKWELDTNGTITISGTGEMSEYAFQTSQHQFTAEENEQYMQELENHKFPWFEKNSPELITNIIIEDGVESISDMAFYGTSIKSISLPNSVKKIGKSSIANCAELEKITLSDNISEIPTGAFNSDYKLTSIELPTKLTSIGASAFLNCESLESIDIPDTVTEIGDRAFANSGLRMLVIPSGVTAVNYDLCNENHNLNEVVFSPNTKSVEMTAFSGCSNLKNIDLPDGLEKIGKMAFLSSVNARIYIPQSVTDIEKKAFNDNAVIYGYANSAAEEFAKNNDIKFVAVNSHDEYLSLLTYSDTDNSSYKSAIDELSQLGIINGFEDGTFKPQDNVTRAQAATMFATALGYSDTKYQNIATDKAVFSDFLMSHWAYKYADYVMKSADISSGETHCILNGFEDGTFRPDNNVTIIQLLKMAICSLGEDGYMAEAVENGGYPNGYNTVAEKYGFSKGIAVDAINQPATREQTAQIISNTINMPIKRFGAINSITADHKTESEKFLVTYDGSKEYYPLTTLKTMLQTNDWGNQTAYATKSPLENSEEFYAYATIKNISQSKISVKPEGLLINTDGSVYSSEDTFEAESNGITLDENTTYYLYFKKINNVWILDNYAIFNQFN